MPSPLANLRFIPPLILGPRSTEIEGEDEDEELELEQSCTLGRFGERKLEAEDSCLELFSDSEEEDFDLFEDCLQGLCSEEEEVDLALLSSDELAESCTAHRFGLQGLEGADEASPVLSDSESEADLSAHCFRGFGSEEEDRDSELLEDSSLLSDMARKLQQPHHLHLEAYTFIRARADKHENIHIHTRLRLVQNMRMHVQMHIETCTYRCTSKQTRTSVVWTQTLLDSSSVIGGLNADTPRLISR